jgi:hypothetical protein
MFFSFLLYASILVYINCRYILNMKRFTKFSLLFLLATIFLFSYKERSEAQSITSCSVCGTGYYNQPYTRNHTVYTTCCCKTSYTWGKVTTYGCKTIKRYYTTSHTRRVSYCKTCYPGCNNYCAHGYHVRWPGCVCNPTPASSTPTYMQNSTDCTNWGCNTGYSGIWDNSAGNCICQKSASNTVDKYNCGNDTYCPAGTYCGRSSAGTTMCVPYHQGGSSGSSSSSSSAITIPCAEPDTDCDPTDYCEPSGLTTEKTDYLLEDIVTCTARINCEDVVRTGDCYEDPGSNLDDNLNLRVKIIEHVSNWIKQTRLQLKRK